MRPGGCGSAAGLAVVFPNRCYHELPAVRYHHSLLQELNGSHYSQKEERMSHMPLDEVDDGDLDGLT